MKNSAYRKRVENDLTGWIGQGLVPATSRDPILASLPPETKGDGRGWIAMAATILAGLAVITFIGDNWAAIPRGMKLTLLLIAFLASAIGAAFTRETSEKVSNGLALLSTLIFSGSIALIGQAYNIPGEPIGAVFLSALGAAFIGLSGRSAAAGFVALVFGGIWIFMSLDWYFLGWSSLSFWGVNGIAAIVAGTAWTLRSRALWHALILSAVPLSFIHIGEFSSLLTSGFQYGFMDFFDAEETRATGCLLFGMFTALWAGLGWLGIQLDDQERGGGRTLAGYSSWVALLGIALLGIPFHPEGDIPHRFIWLGASVFTLWFGASHRYGWVAAAGIFSLLTAVSVIFIDLGMNLSSAALIFAVTAAGTVATVLILKRRADAETGDASHV